MQFVKTIFQHPRCEIVPKQYFYIQQVKTIQQHILTSNTCKQFQTCRKQFHMSRHVSKQLQHNLKTSFKHVSNSSETVSTQSHKQFQQCLITSQHVQKPFKHVLHSFSTFQSHLHMFQTFSDMSHTFQHTFQTSLKQFQASPKLFQTHVHVCLTTSPNEFQTFLE